MSWSSSGKSYSLTPYCPFSKLCVKLAFQTCFLELPFSSDFRNSCFLHFILELFFEMSIIIFSVGRAKIFLLPFPYGISGIIQKKKFSTLNFASSFFPLLFLSTNYYYCLTFFWGESFIQTYDSPSLPPSNLFVPNT